MLMDMIAPYTKPIIWVMASLLVLTFIGFYITFMVGVGKHLSQCELFNILSVSALTIVGAGIAGYAIHRKYPV